MCILIQAGLFSAALVSFIIDKFHDLQVDPTQQLVYYQQQNVALLAQISTQVSSIAPQVSIPSTPLPPYPNFTPNASTVWVNVFWFMSLVFSLSAALLATLVQQWVRDYMHVFQLYSHPLKIARLRQYLYEGSEGWYMPVIAESVPGLVHISLLLFFGGLGISLLAQNTVVGIVVVLMCICVFPYILSTFTPIINPQAPLRNPFSGLIWYLMQKLRPHPRKYSDRADGGAQKTVSPKMSVGQVQLAMEENEERKGRDARAIQWLIHNRTEDDEMESFVMAIPGTFTSKWGVEVWRKVSEVMEYEATNSGSNEAPARSESHRDADSWMSVSPSRVRSPLPWRTCGPRRLRILEIPSLNINARMARSISEGADSANDPHASRDPAIHDLCKRIRRLLDTCDNSNLFPTKELWRKRTRGSIATVASLVFCAGVKLEEFGDLGKLLRELGDSEEIRKRSETGSDGSFVPHWTCLSLVTVTRWCLNGGPIEGYARHAIDCLSKFGDRTNTGDLDEKALDNARTIDKYFKTTSEFCVYGLSAAFNLRQVGMTEEHVREVLARDHEGDIANLERISPAANQMVDIDTAISYVNDMIKIVDRQLSQHIPGVSFDEFKGVDPMPPTQFFDPLAIEGKLITPQFVFLRQRLQLLSSLSPKLRGIVDGRGNGAYQKILERMKTLSADTGRERLDRERPVMGQRHVMERQLCRLQDLRDGGFGYSIERFFLVLAQLLPMEPSRDAHATLYIGTFKEITTDWEQHKGSIGTQRVILHLVCDVAFRFRGFFSGRNYPECIIDGLLELLGHLIEGQSGSHFNDTIEELNISDWRKNDLFAEKAIKVISDSCGSLAPPSPSSAMPANPDFYPIPRIEVQAYD